MARSKRKPGYCKQRRSDSDLAYVELNGHRFYVGKYGTPESKDAYRRLIAEWCAGQAQPTVTKDQITLVELIDRFMEHADRYYRRADGTPSTEIDNYRPPLRHLKELYANTKADAFGPRALKAVRQRLVDLDSSRTYSNKQVARIKHMFKWTVAEELVAPSVYQGLQAVEGLKRGRSDAREARPVKPVPEGHVDAIRPHTSRQMAALVDLQLLTASRSGELVVMRPIDLNTTGTVWTYTPESHKTAHHGHSRTISTSGHVARLSPTRFWPARQWTRSCSARLKPKRNGVPSSTRAARRPCPVATLRAATVNAGRRSSRAAGTHAARTARPCSTPAGRPAYRRGTRTSFDTRPAPPSAKQRASRSPGSSSGTARRRSRKPTPNWITAGPCRSCRRSGETVRGRGRRSCQVRRGQ